MCFGFWAGSMWNCNSIIRIGTITYTFNHFSTYSSIINRVVEICSVFLYELMQSVLHGSVYSKLKKLDRLSRNFLRIDNFKYSTTPISQVFFVLGSYIHLNKITDLLSLYPMPIPCYSWRLYCSTSIVIDGYNSICK